MFPGFCGKNNEDPTYISEVGETDISCWVPGNTDEVIIPCLGVPGIHTSTPGSSQYRHRGVCFLIHRIDSSGNYCYIVGVTIHKTDKTKVPGARDKSD